MRVGAAYTQTGVLKAMTRFKALALIGCRLIKNLNLFTLSFELGLRAVVWQNVDFLEGIRGI